MEEIIEDIGLKGKDFLPNTPDLKSSINSSFVAYK